MKRLLVGIAAMLLLVGVPGVNRASADDGNLLADPDFSQAPDPMTLPGAFRHPGGASEATLQPRSNSLPGWLIENGNVGLSAVGKDRLLYVNGLVGQKVKTQPGQLYEVTCYLEYNRDPPNQRCITIRAGQTHDDFGFNGDDMRLDSGGDIYCRLVFKAADAETPIGFQPKGTGTYLTRPCVRLFNPGLQTAREGIQKALDDYSRAIDGGSVDAVDNLVTANFQAEFGNGQSGGLDKYKAVLSKLVQGHGVVACEVRSMHYQGSALHVEIFEHWRTRSVNGGQFCFKSDDVWVPTGATWKLDHRFVQH